MTSKKIAVIATSIMLLALFCCLALPNYIATAGWNYETPTRAWYEALIWLKGNTAANATILSWWDYGYWIEYVAMREPVCTPSQETQIIPLVAQYLLSDENPEIVGGAEYIILDERTSANLMPAIIAWAGYAHTYDTSHALVKRLYFSEESAPIKNYYRVFDNGVKIFKYEKN